MCASKISHNIHSDTCRQIFGYVGGTILGFLQKLPTRVNFPSRKYLRGGMLLRAGNVRPSRRAVQGVRRRQLQDEHRQFLRAVPCALVFSCRELRWYIQYV
jgi:hypothetical protein